MSLGARLRSAVGDGVAHARSSAERTIGTIMSMSRAQWRMAACFALFYGAVTLAFVLLGADRLFHAIATAASWLAASPVGIPLIYAALTITAFPPVVGFGMTITVCSMAYGSAGPEPDRHSLTVQRELAIVLYGWMVTAAGYVLSASICFFGLRRLLHVYHGHWSVIEQVKQDARFHAMQEAVRTHGLWMAVLIRFCPLPFCYSNLLFASLDTVTYRTFVTATVATSPRLLIHVYTSAKMYELMDRNVRAQLAPAARALNGVAIALGMLAGVATTWIFWSETRKLLHLGDDDAGARGEYHALEEGAADEPVEAGKEVFVLEERDGTSAAPKLNGDT